MSAADYPQLNEQQLDMLRLFKNPMKDEDFLQMRRLAVQLLAKRLDTAIDNWEVKNNLTEENYEEQSRQHFRTSNKDAECR